MKCRRRSWWNRCKERIASFLTAKRKEEEKEKEGRTSDKRFRTRQVSGTSGRLLFLLVLVIQNWLCVIAGTEELQRRTEIMERWQQQQVQVKDSTWVEEIPQRGQVQNEGRGKAVEVRLAKWISVEYREEVHEMVLIRVRYLLWN